MGKWKHGPKSAVPCWFHFDPHPNGWLPFGFPSNASKKGTLKKDAATAFGEAFSLGPREFPPKSGQADYGDGNIITLIVMGPGGGGNGGRGGGGAQNYGSLYLSSLPMRQGAPG